MRGQSTRLIVNWAVLMVIIVSLYIFYVNIPESSPKKRDPPGRMGFIEDIRESLGKDVQGRRKGKAKEGNPKEKDVSKVMKAIKARLYKSGKYARASLTSPSKPSSEICSALFKQSSRLKFLKSKAAFSPSEEQKKYRKDLVERMDWIEAMKQEYPNIIHRVYCQIGAYKVEVEEEPTVVANQKEIIVSHWLRTNREVLDELDPSQWEYLFQGIQLDGFFSEHVLEHLTPMQAVVALCLQQQYLKKPSHSFCPRVRVAVPDGLYPDMYYQDTMKLRGMKDDRSGHNMLWTIYTLSEAMDLVGLHPEGMEYFTEAGFTRRNWSEAHGAVLRTYSNDWRNQEGNVFVTSLLVDGFAGSCYTLPAIIPTNKSFSWK